MLLVQSKIQPVSQRGGIVRNILKRERGRDPITDIGDEPLKTFQKGFTLIEILVVVMVLGLAALAAAPAVMNSLETRRIENEAREVLSTLQQAKFHAVREKVNHRVHFINDPGYWQYLIEREETPGNWVALPGFIRKSIFESYIVTMNFPAADQSVVFSPIGFILNYDVNQNSLSIQSQKLTRKGQPDLRIISVLRGGSVRYAKSTSE